MSTTVIKVGLYSCALMCRQKIDAGLKYDTVWCFIVLLKLKVADEIKKVILGENAVTGL